MEAAEGSADAMGDKVFFNDVSDKEKKLPIIVLLIVNFSFFFIKYCENIARSQMNHDDRKITPKLGEGIALQEDEGKLENEKSVNETNFEGNKKGERKRDIGSKSQRKKANYGENDTSDSLHETENVELEKLAYDDSRL